MICWGHFQKVLNRFYTSLWLRWIFRITLCSIGLALGINSILVLYIYIKQGMVEIDDNVVMALGDIFSFYFSIIWSITLLIALFRSVKYLFNECLDRYSFKLLTCYKDKNKEYIEDIAYGDLVRVWRKWFMVLIWIVAVEMVLSLAFTHLFTKYDSLFEWFSIYVLFGFVLIAGYPSFVLLSTRCKLVKMIKC